MEPKILSIDCILIIITVVIIILPILVYFCVKFGTVAFFKGKQFIEKENNSACCDSPDEKKCEQCQETGLANPNNH